MKIINRGSYAQSCLFIKFTVKKKDQDMHGDTGIDSLATGS